MRKELLSTRRFTVEQRDYEAEDGGVVRQVVVVHPGAVTILPILNDRQIVMIHNHRYSIDEKLLELPAGTREPGEEPIETAWRELEEETGYRAGQIELLAGFYTTPGFCTEWMHAYVATDLTHVGQKPEGTERITVEVMEADALRRMLAEGRLRDGKTAAILGMYFARLHEQSATG